MNPLHCSFTRRAAGHEPFTPSRDEFAKYIQTESNRFAGIIQKAGAQLD